MFESMNLVLLIRNYRRALAVLLALGSALAGLLVAEISLRWFERKAVRTNLDYGQLQRGELGPGGMLAENVETMALGDGNAVRWVTNAAGFRREGGFADATPSGVTRILALGDSFTAGYRVAQDAFYPSLLEHRFAIAGFKAEVLPALVDDPSRALQWLRQYGTRWRPDAVVFALCLGNDLFQTYAAKDPQGRGFHHGLETLEIPAYALEDDLLSLPAWALRYGWRHSRIVGRLIGPRQAIMSGYGAVRKPRLFDFVHGLGLFVQPSPPEIEEAYTRTRRVLADIRDWCRTADAAFVLLVIPQRYQVQAEDWRLAVEEYALNPQAFDLDLPSRTLRDICSEEQIVLIDPTDAMRHRRAREEYYLPRGDMHWNAAGHRAFCEAIEGPLRSAIENRRD